MSRKLIAITPGEPAGIGPDILLQRATEFAQPQVTLVAVANMALLEERATRLGIDIDLVAASPGELSATASSSAPNNHPQLLVVTIDGYQPCKPGQPNPDNAHYLLNTLDTAVALCEQSITHAMVTGPVNKHSINLGLTTDRKSQDFFSGHTEYLAKRTHTENVVMMLAGEASIAKHHQLRVALATTHLPLADVAGAITRDSLEQTLRILHGDLRTRFGIASPRILVCGLNPHAGEQGDMGREEIDTINPVLQSLRQQGFDLSDALPADTLFTPHHLQQADAVLAMYHDQGLPVLKSHCFGSAANITLGLPIIRTSVDHGTAFDLAGTGRADTGSLNTAINTAITMLNC